jgi:hypothetical protein
MITEKPYDRQGLHRYMLIHLSYDNDKDGA